MTIFSSFLTFLQVKSACIPECKTSQDLTSPSVVGCHFAPASHINKMSSLGFNTITYFWDGGQTGVRTLKDAMHAATAVYHLQIHMCFSCALHTEDMRTPVRAGLQPSHGLRLSPKCFWDAHPSMYTSSPRHCARLHAQAWVLFFQYSATLSLSTKTNTYIFSLGLS